MTIAKVQFASAFKDLREGLADLRAELEFGTVGGWIASEDGELESPAQLSRVAADAYEQLSYHKEESGKETLRVIGALLVTPRVCEAAAEVNARKERLKDAFQTLKEEEGLSELDAWQRVTHEMREVLRLMGKDRLHLLHCYRQIPVVTNQPAAVGFTWVRNAHATRPTTRQALLDYLQRSRDGSKVDKALLAHDLDVVKQLDPDTPLRVARPIPPMPKANLTFMENGKVVRKRQRVVHASLPLLIGTSAGSREPRITRIPLTPPPEQEPRQLRIDSVRSSQSLLETMQVFTSA